MVLISALYGLFLLPVVAYGQQQWVNVDSLFQPLPSAVHVYRCKTSPSGKPFVAYYVEAPLNNKKITFATDTTFGRRLTPSQFYAENNKPLIITNGTFFSFATNQNLNLVIDEGKLIAQNLTTVPGRGKDTFKFIHHFNSALGIGHNGRADVAWIYTDSATVSAYASQVVLKPMIDNNAVVTLHQVKKYAKAGLKKWKVRTAIGGGPVLVQGGKMLISNDEERKFSGRAIDDKHPRTAMGYTYDNRLIILAVQGRMPGIAEGATLIELAGILIDLGCKEALNLDGGGSSCLLVNGIETIMPSDKTGQRPVPGVFMINSRH